MVDLSAILTNLGSGIATNAIYDCIKDYVSSSSKPTREGLEKALENAIDANGINVSASSVISILASSGVITFQDSNLFAPDEISYVSKEGAKVVFGGHSKSVTSKTAIESIGRRTRISLDGDAAIRQNEDGSIVFGVGRNGTVKFGF
jgi:hypothetical protein